MRVDYLSKTRFLSLLIIEGMDNDLWKTFIKNELNVHIL